MASSTHITPAPPLGIVNPDGRSTQLAEQPTTTTTVNSTFAVRGKQDISISTAGLLNPDVAVSERPRAIAQKVAAPKPPKPKAKTAAKKAEFGFVNISNPSQASTRQHKSFVKSFVRQQTVKQERDAKTGDSDAAPPSTSATTTTTSSSLVFIGDRPGIEERAKSSLETVPRKSLKSRKRVVVAQQIHGSQNDSASVTIASEALRGLYGKAVEEGSEWEVFRSWNARHPKATYGELRRLIGNQPPRLGQNPFASNIAFPVKIDRDAEDLIRFLHCGIEVTQLRLGFRPVWFSLFMKDSAAFLTMISAALLHRGYTHGLRNEAKAASLRKYAWTSINDRLADPIQCTSDGVMTAVLAFLILDYSMKQFDQYLIAKAGLVKMVDMRGGIQALEHNSELRLVILWDDVGSSTAFDIPPRFGLPIHHLPPLPNKSPIRPSPRLLRFLTTCRTPFFTPTFTTLLHDLFIVNTIVNSQLPPIYDDPLFLGLQINPIVMRLLLSSTAEESSWTERTVATAAVIYLGDVRVKFCTYHLMGYHFIRRLRRLLEDGNTTTSTHPGDSPQSITSGGSSTGGNGNSNSRQRNDDLWGEFTDWKLWVLVVGGMKSLEGISSTNSSNSIDQNTSDREFFRRKVRLEMETRGLEDWDEVKDVIGGLVWIEAIHGGFLAEFGREVMSRDFREGY